MVSSSPVIGFILDHEENGGYSHLPWYAIRQNYIDSAAECGAVPVILPYRSELAESYLDMCDGLVIIGGDFDIPPSYYGVHDVDKSTRIKPARTDFEFLMTRKAIAQKKPILGICGGMQTLGVVLGTKIIQHIPDEVDTEINHEQPNDRHEPGHNITIAENSLLHTIANTTRGEVNSAHHQAVKDVPDSLIVSAIADDGVIEAIELPRGKHPFCLGVQWHPEYHVTELDDKIWASFSESCK
jgi:putative glutamine amidotransferase